jgi:hypothetical protein
MSRASFPRPDHIALLRDAIFARLASTGLALEIVDRGPDHYRCCYRFGFRRTSEDDWTDLSVHFQVAERLEISNDDAELGRLLDLFWDRYFGREGPIAALDENGSAVPR